MPQRNSVFSFQSSLPVILLQILLKLLAIDQRREHRNVIDCTRFIGECLKRIHSHAVQLTAFMLLFELNRSRRFAGDVVEDSVDMRDFIDDP